MLKEHVTSVENALNSPPPSSQSPSKIEYCNICIFLFCKNVIYYKIHIETYIFTDHGRCHCCPFHGELTKSNARECVSVT